MADNVYSKTEIVGTSEKGVDDAIKGALKRAAETLREIGWFEVTEIRGHVENGEVHALPGDAQGGLRPGGHQAVIRFRAAWPV